MPTSMHWHNEVIEKAFEVTPSKRLLASNRRTKVKAFQPIQKDTEEIVEYLNENGIDDFLGLVPGNHYQYWEQRLNRAFSWMFLPTLENIISK